MITEKEIITEFDKFKKNIGFQASFEKIEEHFSLIDGIRESKLISTKFNRQVCGRISDYLSRWNEFLHRIIMPNPGSIVIMEESQIFNEDEKKEIQVIFTKVMELISRNSKISIDYSKEEEAKWIDDVIEYVQNSLKPKLKEMLIKVNIMWGEKIGTKKERPSYSG